MGPPISPPVAYLLMEDFKAKALSTSANPLRFRLRYVDGTSAVHKAEHTQQFLAHLNSLDSHIQFTIVAQNQQGSLPFLDTLISFSTNGSLVTTVYRKTTHIDQCLH